MAGGLWWIVVVLGPILLAVILFLAIRSNRKAGGGSVNEAERGARELRKDVEEDQHSPH